MNLEEVFRLSGVPTHTFVEPQQFDAIKVSLRSPGRCMVLEGPSGIGKTSTIIKAIEAIGANSSTLNLSARKSDHIEYIAALPEMSDIGNVIVDDFHRLPDEIKNKLADFMKILADSEDQNSKLILIGINKAGSQLIDFAHDLGLRIDIFKLESNSDDKIIELIDRGAKSLNITINNKEIVSERCYGSFHIAQVLCYHMCIESGIHESKRELTNVNVSIDVIIDRVMDTFVRQFMTPALEFARGSKIRREGRAPYLHVLKWLADSDEWSLDLEEAMRINPEHKASVNQIVEKGHLEKLLRDKSDILDSHFHFEKITSILSVEDPKLIFFLRHIGWRNFAKRVGYTSNYFSGQYDIALSFAGDDRGLAKAISERLSSREVAVFYDHNEQHRIIARNVEDYLSPIYKTEASYVVALLSTAYPKRIWTKFESDLFRQRFGEEAVIPVRFTNVEPGFFSEEQRYGSLPFDPEADFDSQVDEIVEVICRRLAEDRSA